MKSNPCPECGTLLPYGIKDCPSCARKSEHSINKVPNSYVSKLWKFVWWVICISSTSWFLFTFFYAPTKIASSAPVSKYASETYNSSKLITPEEAILTILSVEVPSAEPRLEFLLGANLNVYLKRQDLEKIPFPDRKGAVERIGETWCYNVSTTFLPTLKIIDIRTGAELASYSCFTGRISVSNSN